MRRDESSDTDRLGGFWALIITQFQGAFSDNLYQWLARFMLIGMVLEFIPGDMRSTKLALVGMLFALPFLLFSMAGGYLADRYSKRKVVIGTKLAEILVMCVALAGLILREPIIILSTVFLMGTQSAFFGPSKYGILPELLTSRRLSWGNGIIELGTFAATITGTICAGWLYMAFSNNEWIVGLILIGLAVTGLLTSLRIDRLPPADPGKQFNPNFLGDLWTQFRRIRKDRVLMLAVFGNTYFFFLAAMLQQYVILPFGLDLLGLNESQITLYLMSSMLIGIGIGSYTAGTLSGQKIEYGLIPLGALGMTIFGFSMAMATPTLAGTIVRLIGYGFFSGFFIVPVTALIQHRPGADKKGATVASANWLSWFGILMSAGISILLISNLGLNPLEMFFVTSFMTVAGTLYALWLLPDAFIRFVLWLLTRSIYRLKLHGTANIPAKGGALFVSNHITMVDALLLQASTDRPIRFIMYKGMYEKWWLKPVAKIMRVIPIASNMQPKELIVSLKTATDAIKKGEIVGIFAEGHISRTGEMANFKPGFERIMKGLKHPVIPICIEGAWGSIFSFEGGRFLWKWPKRIPYPVTIAYGEPMPASADHTEVQNAVEALMQIHTEER
jgi:acyl-[acyl-carrier-protein]-phospholipid O-acyltransferase/long-chain-fatty-acid--[acyl-carrier-protein] ligase